MMVSIDRPANSSSAPATKAAFNASSITTSCMSAHQLSIGVRHVFVNGTAVVREGKHTGAKPGQIVRGAGYVPRTASESKAASGNERGTALKTGDRLASSPFAPGAPTLRFTPDINYRKKRMNTD